MTGDGWAKGSDGIWAKGGKKATLELKTTTGNKRRLLTAQILQSEWQQAGFQLTVTPEKVGRPVRPGPARRQLPGRPVRPDPVGQRPGPVQPVVLQEHPDRGQRQQRHQLVPASATRPWTRRGPIADTNLDPTGPDRRAPGRARPTLAELVPALPLDPFPDIVVVNCDKIGVEGGTFQHNFAYGPFTYLNTGSPSSEANASSGGPDGERPGPVPAVGLGAGARC